MNPPEIQLSTTNNLTPQLAELISDNQKSELKDSTISDNNNLARVRDILFGKQLQDVEQRFARMEEKIERECLRLRSESHKRLDALEAYIKQEIDSIAQRLKTEQNEREIALNGLNEEYKNITNALENKLTQFDEETASNQRELREQILQQSKTLQDDIREKYEEILNLLQRENQELRNQKTDRNTLAALFAELAIQLNSQK
ncbi:coiled-coil domain-containing protein [Mastigocoleus testarum]|uniref:Uncharacterized protein n=1 Tax=Mastigocoleus testarum BC008 TaxID=371196 RepID=A0A0V7ZKV1_9CYAN|nr:hypothetical protein [Mastigocoleus testarum]KST65052.1 hypothetical protein BC008_19805 [Mastigocoleus testarum BC008]